MYSLATPVVGTLQNTTTERVSSKYKSSPKVPNRVTIKKDKIIEYGFLSTQKKCASSRPASRPYTVQGETKLPSRTGFSTQTFLSDGSRKMGSQIATLLGLAGAACLLLPVDPSEAVGLAMREEPSNALSIPTWAVHISSLIEWLIAMGLIWQYADVVGNPKWKGLTWGMVPLHTSGICACTFHFFYNSDNVESLVALQAFLTLIGNFTLWYAADRIYQSVQEEEEKAELESNTPAAVTADAAVTDGSGDSSDGVIELSDPSDLGQVLSTDTDFMFVGKLVAISFGLAYAVKYGSLLLDAPFDADIRVALGIIFIPTGFNVLKWLFRSPDLRKSLLDQ